MIHEFVKSFTDETIRDVRKIGRKYFLTSSVIQNASGKNDILPESVGVFLGEDKKGKFRSSLALLDIISKTSSRKVFIDEKSAWLFLCGRDIMAGSIQKANVSDGFVLIQNAKDENLGLGKIVDRLNNRQNQIVIKNIIDKGDFLRREMG